MKTAEDRIEYIIDSEGIRQKDLARMVNATPQTVNNWKKRNSISKDAAKKIAEMYGYSLEWVLDGTGSPKPIINRESTVPPESEWDTVDAWDKKTPLPSDEVEVPFLRDIELAAGDGRISEDDYNGFKLRFSKATLRRVGANTDGSGIFCFPARGNSMEPNIPDGTTVAVNIDDKKIVDGKIYAINQDGWKRIKLLYRTGPDTLSIRSYNSAEHPPEEAAISNVEIIGRVFWWSVIDY
ncbi:LexA family transcriptional regulator [Dickeya poaceiphila]|uniref:Helix-turn-helix transcriptional regulator n=1 Tax=Dickeya poaceiphila TaxID=568768 RepID=A0A5B8I4F1_9GAMM|nr:helix-turn-helix transcriptional regulator [Dickeya poaceiphila]QDX29514.1 helix-turn-helix transcriptional regulator [Dickeya poaceiphila]